MSTTVSSRGWNDTVQTSNRSKEAETMKLAYIRRGEERKMRVQTRTVRFLGISTAILARDLFTFIISHRRD